MKIKVFVFVLVTIFFNHSLFGQFETKEEYKAWKKKAKEFFKDPYSLKSLMDEKQGTEDENTKLKQSVSSLTQQAKNQEAKATNLENQITKLKTDFASAKAEAVQVKESSSKPVAATAGADFTTGIVFKVQIGAYQNPKVVDLFAANPNFNAELDKNGLSRFTIGMFRNYWDADSFKNYLRQMGMKDAWIVPYKDGQRIALKDIITEIPAKK